MNYKYRVPPCYVQLLSHLTHMNFRVKTDLTLFHFLLRCTLHPLVEVLINKWSGNLTVEMKSWCIFTMSSIEGTFISFFSFLYMQIWYPEWGQTSVPGRGEFRKTPTELFRSKSQLEDVGTFFLLGFQPFPKLCFAKASFELSHELEQYYNCLDFKYNIFKLGTICIPENKVILEE